MYNRRKSGVLLHITSLPNNYGIGSLGKEAYDFVDFLYKSKMSYWQLLPLNAVFSEPSPYCSISSTANNFYLISLEELVNQNLLSKDELIEMSESIEKIDYEKIFKYKKSLLYKAFKKFQKMSQTNLYKDFSDYCYNYKDILDDFALFYALKEYHIYIRANYRKNSNFEEYEKIKEQYSNIFSEQKIQEFYYGGSFFTWEKNLKYRDSETIKKYNFLLHERIEFYKFTQFMFWIQWKNLKQYANEKGIQIIGDIPSFVNLDSADVWINPSLFCLDENLVPTKVAGVPPDYFSRTGQLWGNPLYNWIEHKKQNYSWWKRRFHELYKYVDIVRLDHFRAFDSYWAIPITENSAIFGNWESGPKDSFFNEIFATEKFPIIAEDLGIINDSVRGLRDRFDFPGMYVSHFCLLEHNDVDELNRLAENLVVYTGTHDNQTTKSWLKSLPEEAKEKLARFTNKRSDTIDVYDIIELCASSNANYFIVTMQDILELDDSARMNMPGTVEGNWEWRYKKEAIENENLINKLVELNEKYNRAPIDSKTYF